MTGALSSACKRRTAPEGWYKSPHVIAASCFGRKPSFKDSTKTSTARSAWRDLLRAIRNACWTCCRHRGGAVPRLPGGRPRAFAILRRDQAAFRFFCNGLALLALARMSSSSPPRTAAIKVSMTEASLSFAETAIAALPFSNSIGFPPYFTTK